MNTTQPLSLYIPEPERRFLEMLQKLEINLDECLRALSPEKYHCRAANHEIWVKCQCGNEFDKRLSDYCDVCNTKHNWPN